MEHKLDTARTQGAETTLALGGTGQREVKRLEARGATVSSFVDLAGKAGVRLATE
jgi:hypothetical protein